MVGTVVLLSDTRPSVKFLSIFVTDAPANDLGAYHRYIKSLFRVAMVPEFPYFELFV